MVEWQQYLMGQVEQGTVDNGLGKLASPLAVEEKVMTMEEDDLNGLEC